MYKAVSHNSTSNTQNEPLEAKFTVGIIMGSDSDLHIMENAAKILDDLGIPREMTIISAHRTPDRACEYAKSARDRGLAVIIAGAGGAAHLPGVIAAMTTLPVIGIPIKTDSLGGLDSLLSMVQMPSGIPVATVAINGAANAGLLAARMIGIHNAEVREKLEEYKANLEKSVLAKAEKLEASSSAAQTKHG